MGIRGTVGKREKQAVIGESVTRDRLLPDCDSSLGHDNFSKHASTKRRWENPKGAAYTVGKQEVQPGTTKRKGKGRGRRETCDKRKQQAEYPPLRT